MKIRTLSILALAALAATAACKKSDTAEGDQTQTADSTVVSGQDTVQKTVNEVVPTTDTVVKTTTTETDTVHGNAQDTTHADTTKR